LSQFKEIAQGSLTVSQLLGVMETEVQDAVQMGQAITRSVSEIAGMTQEDAASAEEIAASTEEMSANVALIRDSVRQLSLLMEELKVQSARFVI